MGRISRSFELVRQSWSILMHDKELVVLPILSGLIMIGVAASFFFAFDLKTGIETGERSVLFVPAFIFYVAAYFVGLFFQAAVVAGATERLKGGNPTVASSLAAASHRVGRILMWALVAATVGMILRAIQERSNLFGKIVIALVGAAWSLATFFIVPVLVFEETGVGEAFKRSIAIFKKTWGETMAGGVTLGLAMLLVWVAIIGVTMLFFAAGLDLVGFIVGGTLVLLAATIFPTLDAIFVAALYQYATKGPTASAFDANQLAHAFKPTS